MIKKIAIKRMRKKNQKKNDQIEISTILIGKKNLKT